MSEQIKSLADEIREKLRDQQSPAPGKNADLPPAADHNIPAAEVQVTVSAQSSDADQEPLTKAKRYTEGQVSKFFEQLEAFNYSGQQKSMIRVDAATMKLLRRLKLVRGIEMNKVIVFALHHLLSRHSWLQTYIQDSLKNPDL